jgi:hypothetical protein
MVLSIAETIQHHIIGWLMSNELESILKEEVIAKFKALLQHMPDRRGHLCKPLDRPVFIPRLESKPPRYKAGTSTTQLQHSVQYVISLWCACLCVRVCGVRLGLDWIWLCVCVCVRACVRVHVCVITGPQIGLRKAKCVKYLAAIKSEKTYNLFPYKQNLI